MPNKYKVEFIIVDNYDSIGEEPLEFEEIKFNAQPIDLDAGVTFEEFKIERIN